MERNEIEVDRVSDHQRNNHDQREVAVPLLQPQLREEFETEPEQGSTTEETQMSPTKAVSGRWDLLGLTLVIVSTSPPVGS